MLFRALAIPVLLGALVVLFQVSYDPAEPLWEAGLQPGTTVLLGLVQFYRTYGPDTTIPLDTVEDLSLDEDERELSVTYAPQSRFWPEWFPDTRETSLRLRAPEDYREAKRLVERFERRTAGDRDGTTAPSGDRYREGAEVVYE